MLRSACPRAAGLSALFPFEAREINLFGEALSESCKRGFFLRLGEPASRLDPAALQKFMTLLL